jgi:CubicO group peptidase (beta-lactamase class C family)
MLMERTEAERLRYEPGQSWGYSNIGYMLVTDLIERTCGQELGDALTDLVLRPLGIAGVRLARVPADLHDVRMGDVRMGGVASYHPGWVSHGLLVGPLGEAALLLDRLMRGATLEPELLAQMGEPHWLDPARATSTEQRPWRTPGYGLGVMCGVATNGRRVIGHTGGGPGSVIAVFCMGDSESPITSAAFALGNEPAGVECRVTELENAPNPRWGVSQEGPTATNR